MKIQCNTKDLTNACLNIQRCVPSKAVMPHLECILLRTVGNDSLSLSGFDLELGITTLLPVQAEKTGAAVLNAKTLCDILRHLPDESVLIDCDEKNMCTIRSGNAEYTLISLSPEDYPELPAVNEARALTVRRTALREMIKQTIFAVSMDDSKAVHRGIRFEISPGEIRLVALDGYRLAIRKDFIDYSAESFSFVVPSKTLAEVVKFIDDEDAFMHISVGARHILFEIGSYTLISRLLEGEVLNYRSAIPTAKSTTVRVNTRSLIECIERASIIINEKMKIPVRFIFDEDVIRISVVTALGSANDRIAGSINGKRTEIGFNNRFILDALRSCDTDEVLIDLNGPIAPAVILPPEGESFLYLVLPVRLDPGNAN